ncbi:ATP-binding cassette domain-containing protein [uncultured Rikenella sp.]|uniref:ATP-binding cassette domain-containing protein n=1 Tax=uncultured Rikenella sp. TaxID=368003 RepID=UPI00263989C5|nr:ATP-binding cassette domain-containing protein [uncultured Rikenella sp.]
MSLIANGISYRHHPHSSFLFENLTLSVPKGAKVSLIGPNGAGKTTLLHLLAGRLSSAAGSLVRSSTPYLVAQQTASDRRNVAELLGIAHKLRALRAICSGSVEPDDFETLGDDWEIEAQSRAALNAWGLSHVALDTPSDALSGGERTKTLLAGWTLHDPAIVLLDEPTNHLDIDSLAILTDTLRDHRGSLVVISHDDRFVREIGVTETVELSIG